MRKLSVNFIANEEKEPSLKLKVASKEDKPITIEDHSVDTAEKAKSGNKIEIDADVLEALVAIVKEKKENKGSDNEAKLALALDRLAEATEQSGEGSRNYMGGRPVDIINIDKEDLITENNGFVMFFAKCASYSVYDDIRFGHTVKTPYGRAFKFKTLIKTVDKSSAKSPVYMTLSSCVVRSKKEADWLRKHTLFGIKFHEQREGGKDITDDLQDKIIKAWGIVTSYDDHTVMQRCLGEGIALDTTDISVLRKKLSLKVAKNMSKDEERLRARPLKDLENRLNNTVQTPDEQNFAQPSSTY